MPEAISIGSFLIPTEPFYVLLALLISIGLVRRLAKRIDDQRIRLHQIAEHSVWIGLIGARVGFVTLNRSAYGQDPWKGLSS